MIDATARGAIFAGKYRVERVLGEGGMGVVVLATRVHLGDRVAIKVLRGGVPDLKGATERILREARVANRIESPHVVRVIEVALTDDSTPYLVMELLDGADLAAVLARRGKLAVGDAVRYALEACDALGEGHALGIVHRDLKPANLFLATTPEGGETIKVLDFGLTKVAAEAGPEDDPLTATRGLLGSPAYMSPEQLEAARDVDARTDVWSLGVILFELLTGASPFACDTFPQLLRRVMDAPAPVLVAARPDVPEGLSEVVARCLARERDARFADAAELAEALLPFARS